ncbi:carboxymethylenebutenolidase [Phenylobacterium sp. Root77]|uniref:dienelactone hydrolase family protein n=1 Tax=unclassified Phenylobacterium TaxID=2640670 RepID=UPI0006FDA43A|nr:MULTISPECIES: dienelactone hydrolase family protein [unclassified Phenylobacterium]KQW69131.1 carboxymethylenebutenolidase [Phenylobacterium sp. Root1277]KQW95503.1 carboxymethylenebutenolidase [Phenylobacterium sp. Root1290]KRC41293.1 carboxymethylenebutenolidase [Phenylobacterium sp. Root77]
MGETTTIKTEDGQFAAYVARPSNPKAPAIVVIQEIFGVNAVMRSVCDELAAAGFLAVCPDLFWRIEPGVDITDQSEAEWKKAFELYNAFDVEAGVKDIAATIDHFRGLPEVNGKVGAVGFCLGGLLAYLTAARTDADASVAYYGVGIEKHLVESEKQAHPLLMHIAEEDQFVPKEAQALILAQLKNHPQVEIHTYPGRDHAFARQGGEHYDAADAKLAGGRTLAFFTQHLA